LGANLITFIAKGPFKATKKAQKAAISAAARVIQNAKDLVSAIDAKDAEDTPTEQLKHIEATIETLWDGKRVGKRVTRPFAGLIDQEGYDRLDDATPYLRDIAKANAAEEVTKFLAWWRGDEYARDTNSRLDPDDRKQQIVVCGEMSGGERPEGFGYTAMARAYYFDIPDALGIR
jgi:hypothetical protein